jgi:acetyl-CoA carboxylase biotin carboxyl carrier protein
VALTPEDVRALVLAFESSDWDQLTLVLDGSRLELSRTGRPPQPAAPADAAAADAAAAAHGPARRRDLGTRLPAAVAAGSVGAPADVAPVPAVEAAERESEELLEPLTGVHRVAAPSVGVFWRSPEPGAPPFVEAGQRVEPSDTVCIVEVMKLFNHVPAGVSGVVRTVAADNGEMVEHGQTLFLVDLDR